MDLVQGLDPVRDRATAQAGQDLAQAEEVPAPAPAPADQDRVQALVPADLDQDRELIVGIPNGILGMQLYIMKTGGGISAEAFTVILILQPIFSDTARSLFTDAMMTPIPKEPRMLGQWIIMITLPGLG